ncbi:ABC-type transport auxiliary lipoprotein component domain-containing protein [Bordetella tumbae]|uniref:PqiC family protein n=1 Tax=Bordetella tumbae TaxID=1649139 RepID=UPI0039F025CE
MSATRRIPLLSALMLSAVLAGCGGSPSVRYYTLQSDPQTAARSVPRVDYQIEVAPVNVPQQADQPQIMLRPGQGDGALTPMYSDRWSAPLADEIRSALADTLTRTLGALDVQTLTPAPDVPVWRIQVDVQRFDMVVGGPARLDATWRVRPVNVKGGRALLCRSVVQLPADQLNAVNSLVQAQQQAVVLLGNTIASAIQSGGAQATPAAEQVQMLGCT